jgi:phage terminase large subunit-like protein
MTLPQRRAVMARWSNREHANFPYAWGQWWARANQLPPDGNWLVWLMLAGRGFGKTRGGAEWVRLQLALGRKRIALVGPTAADVRDVMIEGQSGIMAISPPWERPDYQPSKRRLEWRNGAMATAYSAEEPDRLRGPQHDAAWVDELGAWSYPEAWDMLMFGLRLGPHPRACVTTTPRPTKLIRELISSSTTVTTRGSTFDNRNNLPASFFEQVLRRYEGTRLGRQEIYAELLEDVPGALWTREGIERDRWPFGHRLAEFKRIVVAIDPAMTSGEEADETGIIVAAADWNGHGYVLADVSGHYQPVEWARAAISQFHHPERPADRIVAEVNAGGEMVENTLRMVEPAIPYTAVHASRGKVIRAEPVSALYEQHRIHHVGSFPQLEDQMTSFTIDYDRTIDGSPDRVDALVWAFTELLVDESEAGFLSAWGRWE